MRAQLFQNLPEELLKGMPPTYPGPVQPLTAPGTPSNRRQVPGQP